MDDEHLALHRRIEDKLDQLQERINALIVAAAASVFSITVVLFVILFTHLTGG